MKKFKTLNFKHFLLLFYTLIVLNYLINIYNNSIIETLLEINYFDIASYFSAVYFPIFS